LSVNIGLIEIELNKWRKASTENVPHVEFKLDVWNTARKLNSLQRLQTFCNYPSVARGADLMRAFSRSGAIRNNKVPNRNVGASFAHLPRLARRHSHTRDAFVTRASALLPAYGGPGGVWAEQVTGDSM